MNVPCLHTLLAGGRGAHMLAAWVHSFGKNVGSTVGTPTWHTRLFLVIDEPLQLQKHPAQTSQNFQPDPLARRSQLQRSKLQPSQEQCNQWQCSQAVGKSVSDQSIAVQPSAAQLQCSRGTVMLQCSQSHHRQLQRSQLQRSQSQCIQLQSQRSHLKRHLCSWILLGSGSGSTQG